MTESKKGLIGLTAYLGENFVSEQEDPVTAEQFLGGCGGYGGFDHETIPL